jgi:hypothetical protein
VPLLLSAISATPNLPSKEIIALLKPYIIGMFLTSALIQKVCQSIRDQVFGNPDTNVSHAHVLRDLLERDNHDFDIYAKTPIKVKKCLLNVVIEQKMNSVKKDGKMMVRAEKLQYLQKWELANMEMLEDVGLGKNCGDNKGAAPTFLCGIFLSISGAKNTVPLLQTVYQADAAHMNFGKYNIRAMASLLTVIPFLLLLESFSEMQTRMDGNGFGNSHRHDILVSIMLG